MPARRPSSSASRISAATARAVSTAASSARTLVIYPEGVWYRYESTSDIDEILETHVKNGGRVERLMLTPDQLPPKH